MRKSDFYSLLKAVPKAELHIHAEAVILRKTVKKLFTNNFRSTFTDKDLRELFSYRDLAGFLDAFIQIQSCINSQEDLSLLLMDFLTYVNENNIVYCETFFSPTTHLKKGMEFHQLMNMFAHYIKIAQKKYGREIKIIIDVSRTFGEENAMRNLDLVLNENNPVLIGIGLGGDEEKGPAKDFKKVFSKARKNGLHCVAHAGETGSTESVWDTIKLLKAERIGHGIASIKDEKLVKYLADKQIPLEVCPTSNVFISDTLKDVREHPFRALYEKGVMVTLNTDDPTFFKVSLIDEYWNLYSKQNFTLPEIKQIIENGFNASFLSENKKKKYIREVNKVWKDWFAEHPEITEAH